VSRRTSRWVLLLPLPFSHTDLTHLDRPAKTFSGAIHICVSRCARTKASIPVFSNCEPVSWADPAAEQQRPPSIRIEGKTQTIFEGPVSTCGHRVTMRSGGTHHCNGTNNDNNPCPGPTCVTALDDGDKVAKFGFDG